MLRTLHARLALALLGLLLPLGALFAWATLATSQRYFQELTQEINRELAANLVRATPDLMVGSSVDPRAFDALARDLAMTNPGVEVYILTETGEIVGSSVPMDQLRRKQVALVPLRRFLAPEARFPVFGTDPRRASGEKIFSVAALEPGYLYLLLADQQRDSVIRTSQASAALRLSLWGGALLLALAFGVGVLVFYLLTRRLRRLSRAVSAFQAQGFVLQRPLLEAEAAHDELGQLQRAFAEMAERISEQVQGLKQLDSLRRELITNVSHDLRTPLAALQGYLESLQVRRGRLSAEEEAQYLQAATRLSQRLGRLIGDLFDLSKLEAQAAELNLEAFPVQDLLQDVILKFEARSRESGVRLALDCPAELPFVRADLGLIERVLTNLLDNALRYTPSGGEVRLSARLEAAAVALGVADTGRGIAAVDLPFIFERYYRAKTEPSDGEGAGLGLAIAERIVRLHGETLLVASVWEQGSSFGFRLPLA